MERGILGSSHDVSVSFVDSSSDGKWSAGKNSFSSGKNSSSGSRNSSSLSLMPAASMRDANDAVKGQDVSLVTRRSSGVGALAKRRLQQLTINKLKILSMEMFGRDKETTH